MRPGGIILAACALLSGCASVPPADPMTAGWQGVWCWGSPRRSSETPFLQIQQQDGQWIVRTKHYMHGYFESHVRDVHIGKRKLRFSYWYAPLKRWATCRFTLSGDTMAGRCHAETSAQTWGTTPSYLWRQGVLTRPALAPAGRGTP